MCDSYHLFELHDSMISNFFLFFLSLTFLSPFFIKEIDMSNKLKLLNEKKLKECC